MNHDIEYGKNKIHELLNDAYPIRVYNVKKSISLAEEALLLSKEVNDFELIGKSLNQLSLYYMIIGDYEQSKIKSEEAIIYFTTLNDEIGIANAKYNLGSILYKTNNYHLGLVYLIDTLKIYKKYDDLYNQSKVEKAIGTIYEYIGDPYNAYKSYKSSIRIARKIGDFNLESNVYNNLSGLVLKKGKQKIALKMINYSINLKKETNDVRGYAFAIYGRAKVYLKTAKYELAKIDFLESIKIHKEMGDKMGISMAINKLGQLYLEQDLINEAEEIAYEGLKLSVEYNISMMKIKNYHLLYLIFKLRNDTIKALEYLEYYLKEKEAVINTQTLKVIENYELINKMTVLEKEAQLQKEMQYIIDKKNEEEKEAVKLRQDFLSIMSHEIRTPLNAITTIVSMLNEHVDNEGGKMLGSLKFASNNLIRIVNDILDFTKLDLGKATLEKSAVNFKELIQNIFNIYEGMAIQKQLQIHLKTNIDKTKTYLIDETKLTQIIGNLVSNAIKFTHKGQIEINIELLKETANYDTILFKIADTGEGISEDNLDKIFISFSQIKPILTRKQGGTGLGLAIVKKLVKLHNSKIKVSSVLGQGTQFYFKLKLHKVVEQEKIKVTDFEQLKGKIVLLAEDTLMNALLLKKLLLKWGIETEHVVNGKQAIEKANYKKYDFILMDIHMPEMNGYEATKLIRTSKNKNTPIFALTADVTSAKIENNENVFLFNEYLWKPIEIEKLYTALTNNINQG